MKYPEKKAIITGIGQVKPGRRLGRSGLDLTIESTLVALRDAGLDRKDLDGVVCWPGRSDLSPGFGPVSCMEVKEALGLKLNWYFGGFEGPAQISSILMAVMAVASGQARHVLCFRTVTESTAPTLTGRRAASIGSEDRRVPEEFAYEVVFKAPSPAVWTALVAQRRFHEFGLTRAQLSQIALNARANATLNEHAIFRSPLTMNDYMSARMICEPLCLFDCDFPVDASTAIIVSHRDAAKDVRCLPLRIEAMSATIGGRASWVQYEDLTGMAANDAGADLWTRTDFRPKEVDVAQLYDGFSVLTLIWLEALGFCGRGESGAYVEGGTRIARSGELPLNTGGGQLSGGRLHGFGHLHEACVQLRGIAGARQVSGNPKVAVVSNGAGPLASCLLLVNE